MSEPIPAVGYVRVSMAREEMISPELQRTAIGDKAARDGAEIVEWIEELDVSGREFGRKGVQRAISLVRDRVVQRAYVWKYSRFGRNAPLVGMHVGEMEAAGGTGALVSATEDVDARTAAGKFARGMLWQVDQFYSDVVGEQWKEAHARRRKNGLPHNGNPRFGYLYHRPTTERAICPQGCAKGECEPGYVLDPGTGDAAAGTYDDYIAGASVLKIAVGLNKQGFATGTGKPWDQRSLRRYMDSGFCAGLLRIHDPERECGEVCRNLQHKILLPGAHPPLITEETWEEYNRQRHARKIEPPRNESPVYPLAGLVRCGRCESPMWSHPMVYWRGPAGAKERVKKAGYLYQCSKFMRSRGCEGTWIARHRVETAVRRWLITFREDADARAAAERGREKVRRTVTASTARLKADLTRIDGQLTQLTIDLSAKIIEAEEYRAARDVLRERRAAAAAALEAVAAEAARVSGPPVEVVAGIAKEWDYLDARDRQLFLRKIVDRILVDSAGKNGGGKGDASIRIAAAWGEVYVLDV